MKTMTLRATGATAAACLALSLAACGEGLDEAPPFEQQSPASAEPSAEAPESPAAEPEPTAPETDPADPASWTISPNGAGPAVLGMPLSELAEITGLEITADERGADCSYVGGDDAGFHAVGSDDVVRTVALSSEVAGTVERVGEIRTEQDLIDILGDPTLEQWGAGGSPAWVLEDDDSAVLAVGSPYSDDEPVMFFVTDVAYETEDDGSVWWPLCYD